MYNWHVLYYKSKCIEFITGMHYIINQHVFLRITGMHNIINQHVLNV